MGGELLIYQWLSGQELLTSYEGNQGFGVQSCSHCGSTPPPESSNLSVSTVVPGEITSRLGRGSQFGWKKLLHIFGLLRGSTETDLCPVRHRLGWCGAKICTLKNYNLFM